jgi:transcription elongation factor GreA
MTVEGAEALRAELQNRKGTLRQEISRQIGVAREHGDLRENAEYHAAKEEQGLNEARIRDIESKLAEAQVIDVRKIPPGDKVIFGVTVRLLDVASNESVTYKIVGEDEADLKIGKISVTSPVARALIGKLVGDTVKVQAPGGPREYEVDEVRHV